MRITAIVMNMGRACRGGRGGTMATPDTPRSDDLSASRERTQLTFHIDTALSRLAALDRCDELVGALQALGLRVSVYDGGLDVYFSDKGVPTLGDVVTMMEKR
jgi:hypothetical protein